jgi:uncharacterized phosphosugar-binding protein
MVEAADRRPRYHRVGQDLRQRIEAGEWKVGDLFPPERELVARYGISRMTVRQALSGLVADGLLHRQRGKGTFIAPANKRRERTNSMGGTGFVNELQGILTRLSDSQNESLDQATRSMASSIAAGGLAHLYGSGHSVIPVMDSFPRYGSFVGLNPLTDPRLMWWNVLGSGGVRPLLWLERTEGYAQQYLSTQPIHPGDTMIVFSHGGRNAAPVEAALYARDHGVTVVGVTSVANTAQPASHSSGQHLADVSDIVIDTGVPIEDAIVTLEGWPTPVAGASTIVACVVVGELVSRTAKELLERGITMPTFVSPTVPGASVQSNDHVFEAFGRRLLQAEERQSTAATD